MKQACSLVFACLASLLFACATRVPPAAVAWSDATAHIQPSSAPVENATVGYLRVETDRDVRVNGSLSYDYIRRPFDVYDADGTLVRADIDNRGWRNGEDPVSFALPPGRYVVASVYGATYRKVQVDVLPGATTEVTEQALRDAPPVFAR
jgi:hypothetical protein